MGATESKPKIINQKLTLRFDDLNIKDLDTFFNSAFPAIREVELLRCGFISRWNEFVRLSGGIVLKNTKFESCVQAMLWKLSADMNGNLSSVEILENEPFILFKETNYLKEEDIQISQAFQELCRFYAGNYEKAVKLEAELQKYDREAKNYNKDPETLLNDRNVSPMDMFAYTKKLSSNTKKICYAFEIIYEIRSCFEDIRKGLSKFSGWIKIPDQVKKFQDVGLLAKQKNISRPAKIVYKFSKEEKLGEYQDHFDLIQDDLKAEKEARSILELSTRKITVVQSNKSGLAENVKEKIILPTESSAHKDTAESLTEIIKPKLTEESVKEIITKKVVSDNNIENYNTNKNEVIIQPVTNKELTEWNYNGRQAESNMIKSSIVTSYEKPYFEEKVQMENERVIPGRSTIITEIDDHEDPEYFSRIQKEMDDLRRRNEELRMKLQVTPANNIRIRKESKPLEKGSFNEVDKIKTFPVFVRHHIPLKNWNLQLMNTAMPNSTEYLKFKSIEPLIDKDLIVTGSKSGHIVFWKFSNFSKINIEKVLNVSPGIPIKSLLNLNDGNNLFCGNSDGKIFKINLSNHNYTVEKVCDLQQSINSMVYAFNGFSILAASSNKIYEIDIVNKKVLNFVEAHDDIITDIIFNLQKEMFVSCSRDNNIKIWNSKTKECLGILQGHSAAVKSICFAYSHDYMYIASIGNDSYITLWNLTDRNLTRTFQLSDMPTKVIYLWDKKSVLVAHKNGVFTLWDIEKDETKDFFNEKIPYNNGCYLDDGHNIVLTNNNGSLEFWNAK